MKYILISLFLILKLTNSFSQYIIINENGGYKIPSLIIAKSKKDIYSLVDTGVIGTISNKKRYLIVNDSTYNNFSYYFKNVNSKLKITKFDSRYSLILVREVNKIEKNLSYGYYVQ